jgi:hypothetical protein
MDGAIIPIQELTNRQQKRKFVNEARRIALALERINTAFVWEIFNAPDHLSYKDIYEIYAAKWAQKVRDLTQSKQFTLAAIDVLFFAREYEPKI